MVKEANKLAEELLHKKIADSFNLFQNRPEIPNYITDNLSHDLRPYQEEALEHLIFAQESDNADMSFNHLLFHMATGSGKTLVLAASSYLFKQHNHQNFIFFVNTDAIIRKTFDNLTNVSQNTFSLRKGLRLMVKESIFKLLMFSLHYQIKIQCILN